MELLCGEFCCRGRHRFFPVKGRISNVYNYIYLLALLFGLHDSRIKHSNLKNIVTYGAVKICDQPIR